MARLFTSQSELFRHDLFQNPHLLEQCFRSLSPFCFHWDTTHPVASLAGRRVRILKQLLCFKRAIGLIMFGAFVEQLIGSLCDFTDAPAVHM